MLFFNQKNKYQARPQSAIARIRFVAAVTLGLSLSAWTFAWPGGDQDDGSHDHEHDGPRFFGFVKDTAGKTVRDAKVMADIKGLGQVVTRTDATGVYKLPGFGKEIAPDRITISCSKDGYKQARTLMRTPAKKPVAAIEVECTLQRLGAK
jgi:hypothetical protein